MKRKELILFPPKTTTRTRMESSAVRGMKDTKRNGPVRIIFPSFIGENEVSSNGQAVAMANVPLNSF